jgi:2-keto-4-pentenoate hydratase/2-oxohepta-3-ene-1,7-dioic acid hydratase in catechol pathway
MKLVSFLHDGRPGYGTTDGVMIRPASEAMRARCPDLRAVLAQDALGALAADHGGAGVPMTAVRMLPPIPNPSRILCVGLNYRKPYPVDGVAPPDPENIILFGKERQAMVGHGATLQIPLGEPAETFDYEGEIAIVIGRAGRDVPVERAMSLVAGYSAFNDGSVRAWQKHSIHAGKNFERSGSWGPWITTADEIADPLALELSTRLNGDLVQKALASEMIYTMAEQIAYASRITTLEPGDVIATGSPDGTGGSRTPRRFLRDGDRVEIAVSGVGTLVNDARDPR